MKRIKAACLEQTVHFMLKEDLGHAAAANAVREEYAHYKTMLERNRTKYKITDGRHCPTIPFLSKLKSSTTAVRSGTIWTNIPTRQQNAQTPVLALRIFCCTSSD